MSSKSCRKPSPSEGNLEAELLAAADARVALLVGRDGSIRVRSTLRGENRKTPSALAGKWTIDDAPELSRRILAEIAKPPVFPRAPLKPSVGADR